jgi:hypothetical protein
MGANRTKTSPLYILRHPEGFSKHQGYWTAATSLGYLAVPGDIHNVERRAALAS